MPNMFRRIPWQDVCKFLAGAFFVNAGILFYLYLARVSVPLLGTGLTETPEVSGVRSIVHAVFFLTFFYLGFIRKWKRRSIMTTDQDNEKIREGVTTSTLYPPPHRDDPASSASIEPIGVIRSELKNIEDAPLFYTEGAPNAFLEILSRYTEGLDRMQVGNEIIVITWLHLARRKVLKVHPRGDTSRPLTGVFLTRSPDRPNPLGLHRVKILEMDPGRLHIGPIEAIDGTPVIDIKPVVESNDY